MEAATGDLPTGACADASYDTLQRYFVTALSDPFAESNASTLAGVTQLCEAGCANQFLGLAQSYVATMPVLPATPGNGSWCEAVTAPNAGALLGNALPFLCLQNAQAEYCVVEVGKALFDANLLPQLVAVLEGNSEFDPASVDTALLCREMATTGCCANTFLDVMQALLAMTCHAPTAAAVAALFQGCSAPPLEPGCAYPFVPFAMPAACPQGGLVLPKVGTECPIPAGSCPVTQCEFLCAITAADPPGHFAHSPAVSGAGAMQQTATPRAGAHGAAAAALPLPVSVQAAAASKRSALAVTLWGSGVAAAALVALVAVKAQGGSLGGGRLGRISRLFGGASADAFLRGAPPSAAFSWPPPPPAGTPGYADDI